MDLPGGSHLSPRIIRYEVASRGPFTVSSTEAATGQALSEAAVAVCRRLAATAALLELPLTRRQTNPQFVPLQVS